MPARSKANLLTLGCGEGKHSVYCRAPSKESRAASAQKVHSPDGFQGKVPKDRVMEVCCEVRDHLVDVLLIGWW